ncbi:hypothetical protein H4582DRAFT_2063381 [Lactarius indigo]|nr:hypothetical protein H4582DRAFT_2063381 [Lactarius indigo]
MYSVLNMFFPTPRSAWNTKYAVPLNYRTNGRERLQYSFRTCGRVSEARRMDNKRLLELAHPYCDIALLSDHLHGQPLKSGLTWLVRKWIVLHYTIACPTGTIPNGMRMRGSAQSLDQEMLRTGRSRHYGWLWAHAYSRPSSSTVNPAPGTNDAEVLDRLLEALDAHGIVFEWDHAEGRCGKYRRRRKRRGPKPDWHDEDKDRKHRGLTVIPAGADEDDVFATVTNLNAHLILLHPAIPLRTLLLFLAAQQPALDVRACRTPGGVPSQQGISVTGTGGSCRLEHGGRSGARGDDYLRAGGGAIVRGHQDVREY